MADKANRSQELHVTMIKKLDNTKNLQSEADEHHKEFLHSKEKSWKLHQVILEITNQIESLKKKLMEESSTLKRFVPKEEKQKLSPDTRNKLRALGYLESQ